ncbi:prepilin-type N-terminal cleavage/methylation domain-containing protein [Pelagibaculum spongiae]|uniref:prepilin-type N-terminal cleavage/methylation domain-containing protein n=1 Tax=Pelagibaculum spongiae TaxID=2080658 RepID=UPI0013147496|nr:prepilin-type N-terminal cleavage/methylation domain-containing protein [Pelagibaculum spongiae]
MKQIYSKQPAGFSLLEVMITLVLLSLGSLSLGYVQLESMTISYQSKQFSEAELLMEEIANTLVANRSLLGNDDLFQKKPGDDFPAYTILDDANNQPYKQTCHSEPCSKLEFSKASLATWQTRIKSKLPVTGGILKDDTFICRDSDPTDNINCDGLGDSFHIFLSWQDTSAVTPELAPGTDPATQVKNHFSAQLVLIP